VQTTPQFFFQGPALKEQKKGQGNDGNGKADDRRVHNGNHMKDNEQQRKDTYHADNNQEENVIFHPQFAHLGEYRQGNHGTAEKYGNNKIQRPLVEAGKKIPQQNHYRDNEKLPENIFGYIPPMPVNDQEGQPEAAQPGNDKEEPPHAA
jgi:hypothetical protein